uniref:Uncharacterized protein n=1 Tax=Anopheles minimus TaxID=112268 RepID=A0A182WCM0_9DIPT
MVHLVGGYIYLAGVQKVEKQPEVADLHIRKVHAHPKPCARVHFPRDVYERQWLGPAVANYEIARTNAHPLSSSRGVSK